MVGLDFENLLERPLRGRQVSGVARGDGLLPQAGARLPPLVQPVGADRPSGAEREQNREKQKDLGALAHSSFALSSAARRSAGTSVSTNFIARGSVFAIESGTGT